MQALEDVSAAETVLTVGTTAAFAALWLVPRLGQFQERNPETAWQQPGMDGPSWQESHSEAKMVGNTPLSPRRFDQEHYVAQAARGGIHGGTGRTRKAQSQCEKKQDETRPPYGSGRGGEKFSPGLSHSRVASLVGADTKDKRPTRGRSSGGLSGKLAGPVAAAR